MLLSNLNLLATAPGGVARLRELILTLAVQGKLVPQDPKDEPASELLKKIRVEKDRLTAEGKTKRDKPLAEIAEEEKPFDLPMGWEWVRLADVVRVLNGRAYGKQELLESGPTPVLRVGNLFTSNHWYYSSLELEPEKYCCEGDLLYAWSASFGPFIWTGPKAIYHYHIWKLEPWSVQHFDTGYFHKFLAEKTAEIKAAGHGVSMIHMTKEKMEKIVVPYPPLAEQSRIVTRAEELMRLCDALEAKGQLAATAHVQLVSTLLTTLTDSETPAQLTDNWHRIATHFDLLLDLPEAVDALEQTILQLAVRGLLVPQDPQDEPASELLKKIRAEKDKLIAEGKIKRDKPLLPIEEEVPFVLPHGWCWARFPELGEFGRGKSKHRPRNDPALFNPPKYPLIQTGEVSRAKGVVQEVHSYYSDLGLAQSRMWPKGTLCITIAANIAESAVLGFDSCFPDSVVGFVPADAMGNVEYFLLFVETARADLLAFAPATAQKNINLEILSSLLIPVPPLNELTRIVTRVAQLRRLCADLRQRLSASQSTQAHLAEALVQSIG
ncbi:MAG: restriction endonuclease subunit S [Rhodoferax sp.]